MNSWGTAPGISALWNTAPAPQSGMPAWPPYRLPSEALPSSSISAEQTHYTKETARPSGQGLHGPVPLMPEQSTPQYGTPSTMGAQGAVMQGTLTALPQQSAVTTYQAPYSVHNQPHGGLPLESYFTAHLQYPKTWVHLWDRLPLREPETLISSSYKLDMFAHHSAISTLRAVANGSTESAPMLAVCCQETGDRGIRLSLYSDTYEGERDQRPLKVDTFVTVKKTLPPKEQDEIAVVSSLASAFQAACNTSSLPRLCHLLPMQLTAALSTPFESAYPKPESEEAQPAEPPVQLSGIVLQPNVSVSLTQLHRMKVLQCMLTARLMHGGAENEDARFRSGVLSIEQSRSLVPLLHVDPMADRAPLVGIWVTGITSITNSLVLSAALAFHTSNAKRTKAVTPDGSFLVLAFLSSSTKVPEVYEACLTSPRGVPLMPFSVTAQVPSAVDPVLRALSSSPNQNGPSHAERHNEFKNLSRALLIERPHLLYSLFVDRAPQAAASALATVSVPGGTASAHIPTSSVTSARHAQERASTASLSAWRTDAPLSELATSRQTTQVGSTGASSQGNSGNHTTSTLDISGGWQRSTNTSVPYPGSFHSMDVSSTPSRATHLQGATTAASGQGTEPTGLHTGVVSHAQGAWACAAPDVPAPRTGLPPVPSPSPLVGQSMTPLHSHTYGAQQSAAKTPALGMADRGTLHALPGAAITGPGPLSVGSMAFAASTAPTIPRAGRYGPLFDNHHAAGPAGAAAMPQPQQQLPPQAAHQWMTGGQGLQATTPGPAAMQNVGAPAMHSNMHALFVGAAPTPTPTVPAASTSLSSAGTNQQQQQGLDPTAQSIGASQYSVAGVAPASAMSGYGSGAAGVPEWLASAVHRHPDLAPLLRNQAAIVAKEGSVAAETPADGGTPAAGSTAAPASVNGDTLFAGGHSGVAGNNSSQRHAGAGPSVQQNRQNAAMATAATGEHAALAALLNDSTAPSAAASDVYNHLIAPEPDARDLASTRRTSFADDPSINSSAAHSMHAMAAVANQNAPEATTFGGGHPTAANGAPAPAAAVCAAHALDRGSGSSMSQSSGQNTENQAPTGAPAGLAHLLVPHQQQQCTMPDISAQSIAEDCTQSVSQPLPVCSNTCAQEGPSTPRAKRGTCEAHSSSKKQRVSPPHALFSGSPKRLSPGSMQHQFTGTAARGRVGASDALIHMHSTNMASSLAHLPVPALPVSATQDPETASALAPLYDYIGKLRQHIALLQDQVCHLSGRATTGDPMQAAAEQCSQSMTALHISQPPAAHLTQGISDSGTAPNHVPPGCEINAHHPPQAAQGAPYCTQNRAVPETMPTPPQPGPLAMDPPQHTTHTATDFQRNAAAAVHPGGFEVFYPEQPATQDTQTRSADEPAHAPAGDTHAVGCTQNDALEAIVDAFLVSSAGGVRDSLPEYPPPIRTSVEPRQAATQGYQSGPARQKGSDATRHSHHRAASQNAQNRAPFSPKSLNIPHSPAHTDAAANAAAPFDQSNTAGSSMIGTPEAESVRYRMGERGSVAPSECQSSAGAAPWGGSMRVETAVLAASRDGSTHSVRTPPPGPQDGRRAHERNGSGATCLSPELAALIRDAEHVNGQDYEDSLCLHEETSVSEAHASSHHRSSNGGAVEDHQGLRGSRRIPRDVESDDADELGRKSREDNNHALVVAATARSKKYSKLAERSSDLMLRAERVKHSHGATPSRGVTEVSLHNPKRRGSAAGTSSTTGGGHSSRTADSCVRWSAATDSLDGRDAAAVMLPERYAAIPRIQLPPTSAGKKALKGLMKNKGLKKVLHKTELIEDVSGDSNEEDTSTSFSDDDEMQEKLEKKYGLRS